MDGALEFVEHDYMDVGGRAKQEPEPREANQIRARQITGFTTRRYPHWGTVFFGYFLCLYKESSSLPVEAKEHSIKNPLEKRAFLLFSKADD